jgi:hypothetical protein
MAKKLLAIAQASGVELRGATWCRDWCSADFQLCTHFENPDWVPAPERSFSPSGEQAPTYTVDYERGILGLKGCCADPLIRTGNFDLIRPDEKPSLNFTVVMLDRESVANINDFLCSGEGCQQYKCYFWDPKTFGCQMQAIYCMRDCSKVMLE